VSIASADVISLLPIRAFDALSSPFFTLALYAVAFVLSPWVAQRFPILGDQPTEKTGGKPQFGYAVRTFALVALGLVLAVLANVVVYFLGKAS